MSNSIETRESYPEKNADFLRNIYFFHSMSDNALHKIASLCTEFSYEPGTIIFFEDMPGDSFFVVLEGEAEIWKRYGKTDAVLLGVCSSGQPVGEMALIDECPRSATVRSRTFLRMLVIKAVDFNNLLLTENSICVTLLRAVTMMVRRSNEAHITDLDRQNKELARAYTELQALQDELVSRERLSVVGRFSSLILHDIRNPLSALKTRVQLLQANRDDNEYFNSSIVKINEDITRMEHLAAEFLDYARGEIRLNMSVCMLDQLFSRLQDAISVKTQAQNVKLACENSVSEPVILDQERVLRALINASENACKAMNNGGSLTIRALKDGCNLVFEILDTGVGMSPESLERIFQPFYSQSTSGGTGLGMGIIKSIIEAHHGTVSISSAIGAGTRLVLTLPVFL